MTPDGITPNNELKTQGSYGGEELEREIGYIVNLRGEERRPCFPAVAFARKASARGRWPVALLPVPALTPRRGASGAVGRGEHGGERDWGGEGSAWNAAVSWPCVQTVEAAATPWLLCRKASRRRARREL